MKKYLYNKNDNTVNIDGKVYENYAGLKDTLILEDSVELLESLIKTITKNINKEEGNLKKIKKIPLGVLILVISMISLSLGTAFLNNPLLCYMVSLLGFGLISLVSIWGALKYHKALSSKSNLEEKLEFINKELEVKKEKLIEGKKIKEQHLVLEEELIAIDEEEQAYQNYIEFMLDKSNQEFGRTRKRGK